ARVAMKEPVRAAGRGADVAVTIDDDEGIAVLEHAARPCRAGRGDVEPCLGNSIQRQFRERDALDRHETPVSSFLFPAPAAAVSRRHRAPGAKAVSAASDTHVRNLSPSAQQKSDARTAAAPPADQARELGAAS